MCIVFPHHFLFTIAFSTLFLILGIFVLFQAIKSLLMGDSRKAVIPFFEEVAIYEKRKMGKEWLKRRRMETMTQFILSVFLFFQYLLAKDSGIMVDSDLTIVTAISLVGLFLLNAGLHQAFQKIDRATMEAELKGYIWKSNLLSLGIGVTLIVLLIILFSLSFKEAIKIMLVPFSLQMLV